MKKFVFIVLLLFFIPSAISWNWNTHQNIAEKIYYSLPFEEQNNLNLSLIKEGSIAPDKDFHDNVLHHYPPSLNKSLYWLNLTLIYIQNKDYEKASYSFGVLTHYVDDSFVAPHYISKEDPKLHSEFEKQVSNYNLKAKCQREDYDLNQSLYIASLNRKDWEPWLLTKNRDIPQQELEDATKLLYSITLGIFNATCAEPTKFTKQKFFMGKKIIIISIIILILIAILIYSIFKDKEKDL